MSLMFYGPVIFVQDIERSKNFYIHMLEQEIEHDFGANIIFKSKLSVWRIPLDHEIAETRKRPAGNEFELYFETDDIQKISSLIKSSEVKLLHGLKTEPWGQRTLRFYDPDGHLIEVGEALKTFVRRIYEETGTISATSLKTGVSEADVRKLITS